jgi:hypothetical protein
MIVESRHQRTPVQHRPVAARANGTHERERRGSHRRRIGLDTCVFDTGVREQQRDLEVDEPVQPFGVIGLHGMPRDDEHMIAQAAPVEVFEYGEGVWPHKRQERIGCPVEELERRHVGLEVAVADELDHRLGVGHESARLALVPQTVGVPDAVGTIQRTALNVIQAETTLAVLDNFAGALGQTPKLGWRQQWNGGAHVSALPTMRRGGWGASSAA